MVTKFDIKYNNFTKSLAGLKEYASSGNKEIVTIKAALFDFTASLEQLWKLLKYMLITVDGCDGLEGSKKVFRTCAQSKYISIEEEEIFLQMVNLRNDLAHEYNDVDFERYFEKIKTFLPYFEKINEWIDRYYQENTAIFEKDRYR